MDRTLLEIAEAAIRSAVEGTEFAPVAMADPAPWGVFVSLHTAGPDGSKGALRGCVGNLNLTNQSVQEAVGSAAIAAATGDPRFPPLTPDEVGDLTITVYLLDPPETVADLNQLDPRRYGILIESGQRRGLLLPDLAGIDDAATQVRLAKRKAGIGDNEPMVIKRFTAGVIR